MNETGIPRDHRISWAGDPSNLHLQVHLHVGGIFPSRIRRPPALLTGFKRAGPTASSSQQVLPWLSPPQLAHLRCRLEATRPLDLSDDRTVILRTVTNEPLISPGSIGAYRRRVTDTLFNKLSLGEDEPKSKITASTFLAGSLRRFLFTVP